MNHPKSILEALDRRLTAPTELVLYGRAALALGFEQPRAEFAATLDVDAILPLADLPRLEADDVFWTALEETNNELESQGLYMTHLFVEDQVILSEGWYQRRVPIEVASLQKLRLFRPDLGDLILTKMMRVDPQDRDDILFLLGEMEKPQLQLPPYFDNAHIPPIPEIEEAFRENKRWILSELE
ncbi:MAG: DUF6036 family nucleotidyltransferase [Akkermansiaceae bacterium]